jgi:hypothetical protein
MQQEQQVDKSHSSTRPSFTGQRFSRGGLRMALVVWTTFTIGILVLFVGSLAAE